MKVLEYPTALPEAHSSSMDIFTWQLRLNSLATYNSSSQPFILTVAHGISTVLQLHS